MSKNEGVIIDNTFLYEVRDSITSIDSTMKKKMWFKDSTVIDEVRSLYFIEDAKNTTVDFKLEYYRFTDLRTKNVWIFSSFSDTATAMRRYNMYDSTDIVGGWDFKRKWEDKTFEFKQLRDTVIHNEKYHIYVAKGPDSTKNDAIFAYAAVSSIYPIFSLDYNLSSKIKLPILKTDYSTTHEVADRIISSSLSLLRDTLTIEEKRVFEAWEQYAKKHPPK
ncbi:hypothetical protein ACFS6H_14260 [Terrimonas rubra]|uniref:Uncharacterized protein n=1 Tax=Terrimonas rubra TaxID=1035890 RepID=A0ABW6A9M1_9BACT